MAAGDGIVPKTFWRGRRARAVVRGRVPSMEQLGGVTVGEGEGVQRRAGWA